ncbi:hypothetical protein [Sodalis sp. (in: enterobacteria)]|uniref:hypothetical protein n=1 Tax=Sodalis sp. (in: enterobacteria) TaxID=1898979 RepID=UPI003F2AF8CD
MVNEIQPGARPWITCIIVLLIGLTLTVGGVWLLALGGSAYYLIAGLALLLSAGLLWARRSSAQWVMALILIATLLWSLYEAGLNFWQLEPRLVMLAVLGILLLLPWVRRKLFPLARTAHLTLAVCSGQLILATALDCM